MQFKLQFLFSVKDVHDPVALTRFARSLQTTQDPGVLYRRFCSHVQAMETNHLVGQEVSWEDELEIRKIVSIIMLLIL